MAGLCAAPPHPAHPLRGLRRAGSQKRYLSPAVAASCGRLPVVDITFPHHVPFAGGVAWVHPSSSSGRVLPRCLQDAERFQVSPLLSIPKGEPNDLHACSVCVCVCDDRHGLCVYIVFPRRFKNYKWWKKARKAAPVVQARVRCLKPARRGQGLLSHALVQVFRQGSQPPFCLLRSCSGVRTPPGTPTRRSAPPSSCCRARSACGWSGCGSSSTGPRDWCRCGRHCKAMVLPADSTLISNMASHTSLFRRCVGVPVKQCMHTLPSPLIVSFHGAPGGVAAAHGT